jgi:hypothetical protein
MTQRHGHEQSSSSEDGQRSDSLLTLRGKICKDRTLQVTFYWRLCPDAVLYELGGDHIRFISLPMQRRGLEIPCTVVKAAKQSDGHKKMENNRPPTWRGPPLSSPTFIFLHLPPTNSPNPTQATNIFKPKSSLLVNATTTGGLPSHRRSFSSCIPQPSLAV